MLKTERKFAKIPVGDLFILVTSSGSAIGRKIAPDRDALLKYKDGELSWENYEQLYIMKLQQLWDARDEAILTVAKFIDDSRTLWLLSWEKESNPQSSRKVLKKFLEDHYPEIKQSPKTWQLFPNLLQLYMKAFLRTTEIDILTKVEKDDKVL